MLKTSILLSYYLQLLMYLYLPYGHPESITNIQGIVSGSKVNKQSGFHSRGYRVHQPFNPFNLSPKVQYQARH